MHIKWFYFLKLSSTLFIRFFGKIHKTLNVGKIGNYNEERVFFSRKKRFHLFKSLLHKNGKAQNICRWYPVVLFSKLLTTVVEYKLTQFEAKGCRHPNYVFGSQQKLLIYFNIGSSKSGVQIVQKTHKKQLLLTQWILAAGVGLGDSLLPIDAHKHSIFAKSKIGKIGSLLFNPCAPTRYSQTSSTQKLTTIYTNF